jgi:hypothetical protein
MGQRALDLFLSKVRAANSCERQKPSARSKKELPRHKIMRLFKVGQACGTQQSLVSGRENLRDAQKKIRRKNHGLEATDATT